MARKAVTIGFSATPELVSKVEQWAREQRISRSELFRDMVRSYEVEREMRIFEELAAYGRRGASERGITSEEDVVRIIHEQRGVSHDA